MHYSDHPDLMAPHDGRDDDDAAAAADEHTALLPRAAIVAETLNELQLAARAPSACVDEWEIVDAPPLTKLCADILEQMNEWLDMQSQLNLRLSCRQCAAIHGATWTCIAQAVREAHSKGVKLKARDVAIGAAILTLGVAATGASIAGIGAALFVIGGKGGVDLSILIAAYVTTRTVGLSLRGVDRIEDTVRRPTLDRQAIVGASEQWNTAEGFDVLYDGEMVENARRVTDVIVAVERERFNPFTASWQPPFLPIDPPHWECRQLGIARKADGAAIRSVDDLRPSAAVGWEWTERLWWHDDSPRPGAMGAAAAVAAAQNPGGGGGDVGWRYGFSFLRGDPTNVECGPECTVRARVWRRGIRYTQL